MASLVFKILTENVTRSCKKSSTSLPNKINMEAKRIGKKFNINEKMEIMAQQPCFVTVKDHKEDFRSNRKLRLLNPTKSKLGKLSKNILQKINNEVSLNLKVNQCQNSSEVTEWFKNTPNKNAHTFTVFDIPEFCPSIKEDLLRDAVSFTQNCIGIHPNEIEVIFHSR